jgi:tetratricopeptide (TPR) repeat protein
VDIPRVPRAAPRSYPLAWILVGVGLVVLLLIAGVAGVVAVRRPRSPYVPTPRETVAEKYRSAAETYRAGDARSIEPGSDEARVRQVMSDLVAAHAAGNGAAFGALMHERRMLAEIEAGGAIEELRTRKDEAAFLAVVRRELGSKLVNAVPETHRWKRLRTCEIRFIPGRAEAQAFCRIVNASGETLKLRWWVIKEDGAWKVFDFEDFDSGLRMSTAMASMAGEASRLTRTRQAAWEQAMQALRRAQMAVAQGDWQEAHRQVRASRASGPAASMLAYLDVIEAAAFHHEEKYEEALRLYDQALVRQRDLPMAHHGRGSALYSLGRLAECVAAEQEYVRLLGDDAEALLTMGRALSELGREEEAHAAWRRGAASDDEEADCRYELGLALVEKGDVTGGGPLLVQSVRNGGDAAAYFDGLAGALEGAGAWSVLADAARECLRRVPGHARAGYLSARALRRLGRLDEAERAARAVAGSGAEDLHVAELVFVLAARGKHDEAMAAVKRIAMPALNVYATAFVHASARRTADAVAALTELSRVSPGYLAWLHTEPAFDEVRTTAAVRALVDRHRQGEEYRAQAQALEDKGDWGALLKFAKERITKEADDWTAHYHRARSLRELRLADDAAAALALVVKRAPDSHAQLLWSELVYAQVDARRTREAVETAMQFASLQKENPLAHYCVAHAAAAKGPAGASLSAMERTLELDPSYAEWFATVAVFEAERRLPKFEELLKRARGK